MKDLPKSVEAEQGLLGSMLLSPKEVIGQCLELEGYFYVPAHQSIYEVLVEMWTAQETIDLITLTQKLRDKNLLDTVGGPAFVTNLYTFIPSGSNWEYYLSTVKEKYILRKIISTCTKGSIRAQHEQDAVPELLSEITSELSAIAAPIKTKRTFKDLLMDKLDRMENNEPEADILKTGIIGLDKYSPLRRGDMPLIVGERKDGKSILALTIVANLLTQGHRIEYFSLESPESEIVDRLFAGNSRIPMDHHHVQRMNEGQLSKATNSISSMKDWKLSVNDDIYSLPAISAQIRQVKALYPDLVMAVVDYAQLVIGKGGKDGNREQEVASVSRGLRLVSLHTKVTVLLISQLNDNRKARESRALENDTTACWELLRDEDTPNERKIIIPYQRYGESGISFPVTFLGNVARVENKARDAS